MKERFRSKYAQIAVYALLVIAAGALIIIFIFGARDFFAEKQYSGILGILNPFILGFAFAYLLNPLLKFFENRVFGKMIIKNRTVKKERRIRRMISLLATFITATVFIALLVLMIVPQVGESADQLVTNVADLFTPAENADVIADSGTPQPRMTSDYLNEFDALQNEITSDNSEQVYEFLMSRKIGTVISDAAAGLQKFISGFGVEVDIENSVREISLSAAASITVLFTDYFQTILDTTANFIVSTARQILNILIALVIAFYILSDKEHLISQYKRVLYAILPNKIADGSIGIGRKAHKIFGGFINGKLLDSLIIGLICFVFMIVFRFDYAVLISVLIGITNIIPFFGPFIGAIPSIIFLIIKDPSQALWFTIFILILQQIDGNIIGPKIIGDTIGLSSFWVIFSILVMNGLLGPVGMFIGVPLFTVIYTLIKDFANLRMARKGMRVYDTDPDYLLRASTDPLPPLPEDEIEANPIKKLPAVLDKLARSINKYMGKDTKDE